MYTKYQAKKDLSGKMLLGTDLKTGIQFLLKRDEVFYLEISGDYDAYILTNERLFLQVNREQLNKFFKGVE